MKKYILFFCCCIFLLNGCSDKKVILNKDLTQIYNSPEITIFKTKKLFHFFYQTKKLLSLQEVLHQNGFAFAINGSYFGYTGKNDNEYIHAGYLKIGNNFITPIKTGDKNITHFVIYQTGLYNKSDNLFFIPNDGDISNYTGLIFQVGPLLVSGDNIQYDLIKKSGHGAGRYYRTLLGTDGSYKYFIIIKNKKSLFETVDLVLKNEIVSKSGLSLINLDGGPSSSFDSKFGLQFGNNKKLPIIFGVK